MAWLADIAKPAKPSYDDWLRSVADSYANNQWESLGFAGPAGGAGSKAVDDLLAKLRNNPGMSKLYDQGITPDQITKAPLSDAGAFDSGGFGTFGGRDYADLTDAQKHLVDTGAFARTYNPTLNDSGGYYWQATDKAPGVLGSKGPSGGTAAFTQYNPFNSREWKNAGNFAFDPNYGLVTSQSNRQSNKLDDFIYQAAPAAFIAGLGGMAAFPSLASTGVHAAESLGRGGNPISSLVSMIGSGFGVPSWATGLASAGLGLARGQKPNPINAGMSLARIVNNVGPGG